MLKSFLLIILSSCTFFSQAQVAISTSGSVPDSSAMLDVRSNTRGFLPPRMTYAERTNVVNPAKGLMVYQTNDSTTVQGFYLYNGAVWKQVAAVDDIKGGSAWTLSGNNLYSTNLGNVGIGNAAPAYKLDVVGKIHSTSDLLTDGYVGIGTTTPAYKLQVNDGSMAIYNTSDAKTWSFNYSSSGNYLQVSESGTTRFVFANGGSIGIGTTAPAAKLDVNGTANVETNLTVGGTTDITGNLTVNNGKGVVRSWNSTQLKYYTQQSTVHAVLGAFGTSIEGTIAIPAGIFTTAPKISVGDIASTGGTVGTLYRVQMVTYDATATGCHFRLINTSNGSVDYNITWNVMYIGN